jgi:hypothetical protein
MTLTFTTNCRALTLAAGMLLMVACPGGEKETETGAGTDTTASTDGQSSTSASTGENPTTGNTGTTDDGGSATGTESATSTSGSMTTATTGDTMGGETTTTANPTSATSGPDTEGTTGEPPPELGAACQAACEKFFDCELAPVPSIEECVAGCIDSLGMGPECLPATITFDQCLATMTCDELQIAFDSEKFGPCQDEFDASQQACVTCEGFGSGGNGGCSIGQACPDQPTQEYSCMGDTCTCLVDDQPQSECMAPEGICDADFDAQAAAAFECCGFEF